MTGRQIAGRSETPHSNGLACSLRDFCEMFAVTQRAGGGLNERGAARRGGGWGGCTRAGRGKALQARFFIPSQAGVKEAGRFLRVCSRVRIQSGFSTS